MRARTWVYLQSRARVCECRCVWKWALDITSFRCCFHANWRISNSSSRFVFCFFFFLSLHLFFYFFICRFHFTVVVVVVLCCVQLSSLVISNRKEKNYFCVLNFHFWANRMALPLPSASSMLMHSHLGYYYVESVWIDVDDLRAHGRKSQNESKCRLKSVESVHSSPYCHSSTLSPALRFSTHTKKIFFFLFRFY